MQLLDLPPAQIHNHPKNPRRDVGDVTELAASITAKGVLEPLIVVPDGTGWTLIAGHRRLAAALQTDLATVPAIVRDDLDTIAAQVEAMLVENLQRADLTPIEEAACYQSMLEFPGYTIARITKSTGRTGKTVRARLALTKLTDTVQGKIATGQITLEQAAEIAKHATDRKTMTRLERAAGTRNWDWTLGEVNRDATAARAAAKLRKQAEADGHRVLEPTGLPTNWHWRRNDLLMALDTLGLRPEEHTDCPGHGVVVITNYGDARDIWACDQPTLHPPADAGEDEAAAGRAAADAERQATQAALATSTKLRMAHLRFVLDGLAGADHTPGMARDLLLGHVTTMATLGNTAAVNLARDLLSGDTKRAVTDDDIAAFGTAQLTLLAVLLHHASGEDDLRRDWGWTDTATTPAGRFRALLGGPLAYEWSDTELSWMADDQDDIEEDDEDQGGNDA